MPTLHITRGLPASGKTTMAEAWVAEDVKHRARVNRDDIRRQLHGGVYVKGTTERYVVSVRNASILALLRDGLDVICDDTNLRTSNIRDLRRLAAKAGADTVVHDLTDVHVDLCVVRDEERERPVGERVVRDLHARFVAGRGYPLPLPMPQAQVERPEFRPVPYVRPAEPDGAPVVIVDIDGTVAKMADRSPYDMTRLGEDTPNTPVITVVRALRDSGLGLLFMSGRTEDGREATEAWLDEHVGGPYIGPFMRAVGDRRRDDEMKAELFDQNVRGAYDVALVVDDRDQVVRMWRAMGLVCLQVAPGAF